MPGSPMNDAATLIQGIIDAMPRKNPPKKKAPDDATKKVAAEKEAVTPKAGDPGDGAVTPRPRQQSKPKRDDDGWFLRYFE